VGTSKSDTAFRLALESLDATLHDLSAPAAKPRTLRRRFDAPVAVIEAGAEP